MTLTVTPRPGITFDPNTQTENTTTTTSTNSDSDSPLSPATPAVIGPSSNLTAENVTTLPRNTSSGVVLPQGTSIAPQGSSASATLTPENLRIEYDTAAAGWAGGGYAFDNFGDASIQTVNLSGLSSLIVGLTGIVSRVKFEVVSWVEGSLVNDRWVNGYERKDFVYLNGIRSDVKQFWQIQTSLFDVDWTHVRLLYFIIEGSNQQGTLEARVKLGPIIISPSTTLTTQSINIPEKVGIAQVAAAGDPSWIESTSQRGGVRLYYKTRLHGWTGGGFSWNRFDTPELEFTDVRGLSHLRFGLQGDTAKVKVTFIDASRREASIYLTGISSKEQVYEIPTAALDGLGLDISAITTAFFIVEGAAGQVGTLTIYRVPPQLDTVILPSSTLKSQDIYVPGNTWAAHVAPAEDHISRTITTPYGVDFSYSTQYKWAGTGFSWDDFSTPDVGSANLDGINLRFGIRGDTSEVMFEAIDASGNKVTGLKLAGIRFDIEQVYEISTATLTRLNPNFDASQFRIAYFIVVTDTWKEGNLIINKLPPKPESTTPLEQPFKPDDCSGATQNFSTTEQAYQYCFGAVTTLVGSQVRKLYVYFWYQRGNTGLLFEDSETHATNSYSVPGLGFSGSGDLPFPQPDVNFSPGGYVITHSGVNLLTTIDLGGNKIDLDYLPTTSELLSVVFNTNTSGRIVTQRGEEFLFTIDPFSGELTFYPVS